jgi:hypothetical protein
LTNASDHKKALKAQYKEAKPQMGVYVIRSKSSKQCFVGTANNLPAVLNGARFKLNGGMFVNRGLQEAWSAKGEGDFGLAVLDTLEYEKDEAKTDYRYDLLTLQKIWEDKLLAAGWEFYQS